MRAVSPDGTGTVLDRAWIKDIQGGCYSGHERVTRGAIINHPTMGQNGLAKFRRYFYFLLNSPQLREFRRLDAEAMRTLPNAEVPCEISAQFHIRGNCCRIAVRKFYGRSGGYDDQLSFVSGSAGRQLLVEPGSSKTGKKLRPCHRSSSFHRCPGCSAGLCSSGGGHTGASGGSAAWRCSGRLWSKRLRIQHLAGRRRPRCYPGRLPPPQGRR